MPQLNQLPEIWWSQLFWLTVVFGLIFFVIARGMLPKIQGTVELRERKIAADLEAAQAARHAADETEAAWRARMDAARADAAKLSNDAKQASSRETEAKVKAAVEKINLKADASEQKIREAVKSARSEIESVAVGLTQDLVTRLTGLQIDEKDAAQAVKAELNV
jgi:F-type H+-transporting ATPase subunit b